MSRKPKYSKPEEMQALIDKYFMECDTNKVLSYDDDGNEYMKHQAKPYTITGLGLALNMSRQDLINYQAKKDFKAIIDRAKMRCENYAEEQLFRAGNVTGVIFNLKNNYNYKDKQDIEADVNQTIKVTPPRFDD